MRQGRRTVLVAGGGITGLTLALCLAQEGWRVDVFEQTASFEGVGAGLQISPNAYRILDRVGVTPHLKALATRPAAIRIMAGRTGRQIAQVPLGEAANERYGAPYLVAHRADLQQALATAVGNHPDITLYMGHRLEDFAEYEGGVTALVYSKGRMKECIGALVVAADGVWSDLRNRHLGLAKAKFSNYIAWRGLIPTDRIPTPTDMDNVQLWLAPNAHVVTYPVRGGRFLNLVAITSFDKTSGPEPTRGWAHAGEAGQLRAALAGWHDDLLRLLDYRGKWTQWPLFAAPRSGNWTAGSFALAGDAAHAMLPFAAQGAAMGIEDAAILAACLRVADSGNDSIAGALKRYERLRKPRVARARRLAMINSAIYHLPQPFAFARNQAMRALGGERLLARQDWLYNWRAPAD